MPNQHINPDTVAKPTGYTQVIVGQGRVVFISGQVAVDKAGNPVGEGDLAAQANQVFENLKNCLEAAGASFRDVVKMTTYVVNYKAEDRPKIVEARAKYLPADVPPASTLVGVSALASPHYLIEIEMVAVVS